MIRPEPTGNDCNAIAVRLAPVGNPPLPVCRDADEVPSILWEGEGWHASVRIDLGNVDDATDYLRRFSRQLAAFAAQIDAARDERMPEAIR